MELRRPVRRPFQPGGGSTRGCAGAAVPKGELERHIELIHWQRPVAELEAANEVRPVRIPVEALTFRFGRGLDCVEEDCHPRARHRRRRKTRGNLAGTRAAPI